MIEVIVKDTGVGIKKRKSTEIVQNFSILGCDKEAEYKWNRSWAT